MPHLQAARLYCILDLGYIPEENAEKVTQSLLNGGAHLLQLRAKSYDLAIIRRVAEKLLPLCRAAGVPFILNDHLELALELGTDGVHLGQDDGPLPPDRRIHSGLHSFIRPSQNGPRDSSRPSFIHSSSSSPNLKSQISNLKSTPFLFGRSTHSLAQARAALEEGFDYIGFGPLFPTPTKAGRPAIGLQEIATMEREVGSQIPAFCIGGITRQTLPQVLAAGARRVVIVSDLLRADDIQAATNWSAEFIPRGSSQAPGSPTA
ncbi:MAG: thiamine phosphate synthase [Luteolibacter sp.]